MKERSKFFINVRVQPRARKRTIEELGPAEYRVSVLSPPSQGKANREVIGIFASAYDLPKSRVNIIKGEKSRHKVICLEVEEGKTLKLEDKEKSVKD